MIERVFDLFPFGSPLWFVVVLLVGLSRKQRAEAKPCHFAPKLSPFSAVDRVEIKACLFFIARAQTVSVPCRRLSNASSAEGRRTTTR